MDAEGRRAPYYITVVDQPVFAFAGLWDQSVKADGSALDSCGHITTPADSLMQETHSTGSNPHQMPAMLRKKDRDKWMNGSVNDARSVLAQYDPGSMMLAHEVSTRVNTPKNNDPSLLEGV
jgi:putative SOS response-associated peptidase YedK